MTTHRFRQRGGTVSVVVTAPGSVSRASNTRRKGYSLIETILALIMLGVLVSMGIPRFQRSLEQSRADVAGANLRAIWSAQRLYWLENRSFAPDLNTLLTANLIDPSLTTATVPYSYQVVDSSQGSFMVTATRSGSSSWSGSFSITADGTFFGSVQQGGQGAGIVPGFQ